MTTEVRDSSVSRSVSVKGAWLQVIAAMFWLPQAAIIAWVVQGLVPGHPDAFAGPQAPALWALAFFVLGVLRSAVQSAGMRICTEHAIKTLTQLRFLATRSVVSDTPLNRHRPASGEVASILAEQAESVIPYLARFLPARLRAMIVPFCIVLVVAWFSWAAALVLLVAAPLIPFFMALVGWRAQQASLDQLDQMGDTNAFVLDRLRGLATLRTLGALESTARDIRQRANALKMRTMAVLRIAFLSSAVLELFSALGVAMVAVYVGFHLLGELPFGAWGGKLELGPALFILLLAPAFFEPLRDLASAWHDRASGLAALQQLNRLSVLQTADLFSVAGLKPELSQVRVPASTDRPPAVQIDHVSFAYPGDQRLLLSGFSLNVASGEHIAFFAPSGTGKSTLLALVAGLVRPGSGQVLLNNIPVSDETAVQSRQRMGWVGQNPHIFQGSLIDNVALGRVIEPGLLDTLMKQSALQSVVNGRGNVALAEAGQGLSGGELLRVSLARALANSQADLILADEPTAHLDRETARQVTDNLLQAAQHKTLLVATHDPELAARMDRIVNLVHDPVRGLIIDSVCPGSPS
ncbi:MAG: thiol reductant ABC exporter subunit CydD [Alcaligenaceae bacterium]|nr:thiol reductant ABC exporter subunit CydD [Alcaligenaceae bacterium]